MRRFKSSLHMAPPFSQNWSPMAVVTINPTRSLISSTPFTQLMRSQRSLKLQFFPQSHPLPPLIRPISTRVAADQGRRNAGTRPSASADGSNVSPPKPPQWWEGILLGSNKARSIVMLNILTVIYASNIAIVKEVEMITDPAVFTMVRFALAAIPFIPHVVKQHRDCQTCVAGIELGFWLSLGYLTQALGLITSNAGRASFISSFTVIVVPLIDGIVGAAVPAHTWIGALVSLIGVGMLECSGSAPCVGDILNLSSAVFFGIHMLRTEKIARCTRKENYSALLGYEVCVVALFSMVWFFCRGIFCDVHQLSFRSWTWTVLWNHIVSFPWVPALYTGIFSTGLSLWAELAAMRDVSATETAIIYGLEPVWGAGFAWFLLRERWGTTGWIGAALVLCGSLAVQILSSFPKRIKGEASKTNFFARLLLSTPE